MIVKFVRLLSRLQLSTVPRTMFCSKAQILKTYLEIIPPHKIYEIIQKNEHGLQNAIKSIEIAQEQNLELKQQHIKKILKEVKKRTIYIPLTTLSKIIRITIKQQDGQHSIEMRKAYTKIIRTVRDGAQKYPLEEMINFVYKLVKMNKRQFELMKEVEKAIIEEKIQINYPLIRKILFSYTHLNFGSSVLYSHISKTLTIGQHQFEPLQLAESAYMLSKVSENAKGGFGIFKIAEKHLQAVLPRLEFSQLVKASVYFLTQDLGTNKFQTKLEQALYKNYPNKDKIRINDFAALLKSTSGYFFKYKQNALLSILKTSTLRMSKFATIEQFEDIIWSWGKIGKGDQQVWKCLETEVERHLQQLKPRQIAFFYHSLCSTNHTTSSLLTKIEQRFVKLDLMAINQHYLVKFLLGMQRKKLYQNQVFVTISEFISKKIVQLSNRQFLTFLKIMSESDFDYQNKNKIESVIESLKRVGKTLESKIYTFKLTEITQLLYLWIKLEIDDQMLMKKCFVSLDVIINIPKAAFIKAMFCFTIKQKYQKSLQFIPIVEELLKYGPIGYFFSPYEFPLLAYCIFVLETKGENISLRKQLLSQVKQTINQINPIILNEFVAKAYHETLQLISSYENGCQ